MIGVLKYVAPFFSFGFYAFRKVINLEVLSKLLNSLIIRSVFFRSALNLLITNVHTTDDKLSKFLRRSSMIFIIKVSRTIVFIFIVISTTTRPICPPAFFRCLSNSGTLTELRTTSFIEFTGVFCSDSISHNRVQVLGIPVLLLFCGQDWICNLQMIISLEA